MDLRYALSELRKHGADSHWLRYRFLTHVVSRYYSLRDGQGTPLVERDWDHVVLLDACRYDLFEEVLADHPLPGSLDERRSVESGTPGYVAENFAGEQFHDVVYVTANPYVETDLAADTFHAVDHVWRDGWDEENGTVMPDVVAERALQAAEEYPDKRIVAHFNQPHAPFVGEERLGDVAVNAIRQEAMGADRPDPDERKPTPFEMLEKGLVTKAELWRAYRSNLELAVPAVERLLTKLQGKIAVTADHGNAVGEFARPFPIRVYGHPLGIRMPALNRVPWHVHRNGDRLDATADAPDVVAEDGVDEETKARLRRLGYAE